MLPVPHDVLLDWSWYFLYLSGGACAFLCIASILMMVVDEWHNLRRP